MASAASSVMLLPVRILSTCQQCRPRQRGHWRWLRARLPARLMYSSVVEKRMMAAATLMAPSARMPLSVGERTRVVSVGS